MLHKGKGMFFLYLLGSPGWSDNQIGMGQVNSRKKLIMHIVGGWGGSRVTKTVRHKEE